MSYIDKSVSKYVEDLLNEYDISASYNPGKGIISIHMKDSNLSDKQKGEIINILNDEYPKRGVLFKNARLKR